MEALIPLDSTSQEKINWLVSTTRIDGTKDLFPLCQLVTQEAVLEIVRVLIRPMAKPIAIIQIEMVENYQ